MFFRSFLLLTVTFISVSAKASPLKDGEESQGKVSVDLQRPSFSCDGNWMTLKSTELLSISEGEIEQVQVRTEHSGACQRNLELLADLLRNKAFLEVDYKIRKRLVSYHLDYSEGCNETTCSIDVDDREILELDMPFLGYSFHGSSSRSVGQRTVTWPRYSCPPWSPDCDL